MTHYRRQMLTLVAGLLLTAAAPARAQPQLRTVSFPSPNAAGWNNGTVRVMFLCAPVQPCPDNQRVHTEGRDQPVTGSITDPERQIHASVSVNIDKTAPRVEIVAPAGGHTTRDGWVWILARALDGLSGVASATCAGVAASVDERGGIRCAVALMPGVNDVVVEASDRAGNSGSSGIRVTRTGTTSKLRVAPEAIALLVGRPRALQVMDEYGPVRGVTWTVDNPALARISDDTNVLTPTAAGVVTVTATLRGASATAVVTVYEGDRPPVGATRWRNERGMMVIETPASAGAEASTAGPVLSTHDQPGGQPKLFATDALTGVDLWSETPAISAGEKVVRLYRQPIGGALLVVEERNGNGSALVRGGPSSIGTPWRYRSPGRLGHAIVQDGGGRLALIEVRRDGFPELVTFDGRSGAVLARSWFEPGRDAALNERCVAGANTARFVPPRIGAPKIYDPGVLVFEAVTTDDLQDYGVCGSVSGRVRRVVALIVIRADGATARTLGELHVPAGTAPPDVTLLPVASDGRGGFLAPWIVNAGDGAPPRHRLTRVTADGIAEEWTVPVVGEIVRWNDLASMTDGTTLVTFSATTGAIKWTRQYPAGGVRILPGSTNGTLFIASREGETLDEFGRPVK